MTCTLSDPARRPGGATSPAPAPGSTRWPGRGDQAAGRARRALDAATAADVPPDPTVLGGRTLRWGERTHLMGVVNVTPDSFSDGGRTSTRDAAVRHGLALAEAGADIAGHRR